MNSKILVAATVVLVAGVGVAVFAAARRPDPPSHPHPSQSSAHGNGIDHSMAAVRALYHAPEGATPCESAYNAFKNSQDVATRENVTPIVLRLAPRDEFLAHCMAFPPAAQPCLVPHYKAEHDPECSKFAKPTPEVLAQMFEMKQAAEPGMPGVDQEPPEPPPQ